MANGPTLINGDTKILEAIAAGQCDVGLTNSLLPRRILAKDPSFPVAPFWANQQTTGTHVNISGAGITAHAKNRANAVKLLEFLASPEAQQMFADSNFEYPANPQAGVNPVIAKWGKFKQDDINVAAAGEFQAAATSSPTALATSSAPGLRPATAPAPARAAPGARPPSGPSPRWPRGRRGRFPTSRCCPRSRHPAGDLWRHLWRTQLAELASTRCAPRSASARARSSWARGSHGSSSTIASPGAACSSGR